MKYFSVIALGLFALPLIQALPQSTEAVTPQASMAPAAEPEAPLKIVGGNCKGSGMCKLVDPLDCAKSIQKLVNLHNGTEITGYAYAEVGHCTTFYKCDKKEDYPAKGVNGPMIARFLEQVFLGDMGKAKCNRCGSVNLGKVPRQTVLNKRSEPGIELRGARHRVRGSTTTGVEFMVDSFVPMA
ncbi:MAG: hypothetical protein M1817_002845 [Caeruleum heppii]|nr:MAG: hypothetical protein M1817_002845 [Caeruleum heppii]